MAGNYTRTEEFRKKLSIKVKRVMENKDIRRQMRRNHADVSGKNNPRYIDGRTPLFLSIRKLKESKEWSRKVFERDNWTCQDCGQYSGKLEAHHKKPFSQILEEFLQDSNEFEFEPIKDKELLLRLAVKYKPFWNVDNGETLCEKCHELIPKKRRLT